MKNKDLSYIYIGVAEDRSGIKIGVSLDPLRRTSRLPEKFDMEKSKQFSFCRRDAFRAEKSIHFLFHEKRVKKEKSDGYTEWFDFSSFDQILDFLVSNKDKFKWIDYGPIVREPEPDDFSYIINEGHGKFYIDDLGKLMDLQSGHRDILLYVAANVAYDGLVSMTALRKSRIAATLKCSVRSIDNAITEFVRRGILSRVGRAEYELNPCLFAKGSWREIRERRLRFSARITYSPESGRTIETIVEPVVEGTQAEAQPSAEGQSHEAAHSAMPHPGCDASMATCNPSIRIEAE